MLNVTTESLIETQALAEAIGRSLKGGEVIELISDIGGGKTTFVKGLARGLSIGDTIQSPTFTISRVYSGRDNIELHHFDFYRLSEGGVVAASLAEALMRPKIVVVIEWGEVIYDVLPPHRASLRIDSVDENTRQLSFDLPENYKHLKDTIRNYKNAWNLV